MSDSVSCEVLFAIRIDCCLCKAQSSSVYCKWRTNLSSIVRAADTVLVDQGAGHRDEQVPTKIYMFVSMYLLYLEEQVKV